MSCLECKNTSPDELGFRTLEVHTLHIRDLSGERIVQTLGEFKYYRICRACASEEARAFLFPAKRLAAKCLPFALLLVVGIVLSVMLMTREVMTAVKALGPIALAVGLSGIFGKVKEILSERRKISGMSHDEALRYSAYKLVIKNAPKKYNDNDITYIPVSKETLNLSVNELSERYNLLPSIAAKAHELMKRDGEN